MMKCVFHTIELIKGIPPENAENTAKSASNPIIVIFNGGGYSAGINGCTYIISNVGNIRNADVEKDFLHYIIPNSGVAFECIERDYVKIEV